jgi:RNA polymerase-binding transcription factor DksA
MGLAKEEYAMTKRQTLTRAQLRDLETELQRERARLERSLDLTEQANSWRPDSDVADAMSNGGVALQPQVRARYDAVVDALQRMAGGTYGTCVTCGQAIPYGRLVVMPETTRCVSCPPRG